MCCRGHGSLWEDAGGARSREMVSVLGQVSQDREEGQSEPAVAGRGPPGAVNSGVCGPKIAGGAVQTSFPPAVALARLGRQPGPRASCPVTAGGDLSLEPLWAALRPQPRESSRMCGNHGEGYQGTVVTPSPWFVRGRSCGLWGPSFSFLPGGHSFSPEFSKCLESRVSNPGSRLIPRLALPKTGNKSLNFHIPPSFPQPAFRLQFGASLSTLRSPWCISNRPNILIVYPFSLFKKNLFIFGCVGSSLLHAGFL